MGHEIVLDVDQDQCTHVASFSDLEVEALVFQGPIALSIESKELRGAVRDVLRALQAASLTIDELSGRCSLPVSKVAAAVSDLEVEGLARRVEGGRYRLLRG